MKFRLIISIILLILLVIFVLQNTEMVNVTFWFWETQIPRALLIVICLAIGIMLGQLFSLKFADKNEIEE